MADKKPTSLVTALIVSHWPHLAGEGEEDALEKVETLVRNILLTTIDMLSMMSTASVEDMGQWVDARSKDEETKKKLFKELDNLFDAVPSHGKEAKYTHKTAYQASIGTFAEIAETMDKASQRLMIQQFVDGILSTMMPKH
tara:strand:- start:7039 stop:7461 length:423 start_codon:yes stop_codon:yes gene_type:complete